MEDYIQISKLNDFIFCPFSLYYHTLYENFSEKTYHGTPQTVGKIKHEAVDNKKYSTSKHILQGIDVHSEELGICGKIDIFDTKESHLIERKNKIVKIYDGYLLQIHGQYYSLKEMGYDPKRLSFYSMVDNKRYPCSLPTNKDYQKLIKITEEIRNFDLEKAYKNIKRNSAKCNNCIYHELCGEK